MKPADGPDDLLEEREVAGAASPGDGASPDGLEDVSDPELFADIVAAGRQPLIRVAGGRLADNATAGEKAILAAFMPVFQRGASLVRPVIEEVDAAFGRRTHVAQLARVETAYLRDLLCRAARWQSYNIRKKEWVSVDPPKDVAVTVLARYGEWTFPPVVGVLTTPTLRHDGSLLASEGYDPRTRLIVLAPPTMPDLPAKPSRDDASAALDLFEALLEEFPFVDDASRSVALSALITPVVRGAFASTPMHIARAPVAGAGKSYLFDVAAAIAIGQLCPVMAAGRTEEETEKRLGAALIAGQPIISIDNVNGELGGDALCQIIERPVVDIRILGRSERVRIEPRSTTLYGTGNNLVLSGDMTRRAVVAQLDPLLERPELRQFTSNPVDDVLADRGRYVAAALMVVRAYMVAGSPNTAPRLASFEGWSDTVRSALIWLGRADPVATMQQAQVDDPRLAELRAVLAEWSVVIGEGKATHRTAGEVLRMIGAREPPLEGAGETGEAHPRDWQYPAFRDAVLAVASIRGRVDGRRFGQWLSQQKGRIVAGRRIRGEGDKHGHAVEWYVDRV